MVLLTRLYSSFRVSV